MSGSDRDRFGGWPRIERRVGERRSGTEQRVNPVQPPASGERRQQLRRSDKDRRDESAWAPLSIEDGGTNVPESAETLIAAAIAAREHALARYSGFAVGAALETADGQVVGGCNIENATYALTLCAERVALVKALSDGHGVFTRIAVVADTGELTPPCGPCRQLLWEYCGDLEIILANLSGATASYRLSELLPMPFDNRLL